MAKDQGAAFAALVGRHSRFAFKVAFAVLRNSHDAEDAVQETFLKLFRNGGWQEAHDERAFLARAVWRTAVDRLPRRAQDSLSEEEEPASPADDPEQATLSANCTATIHRLIDGLPEELRQPLALSALEELNSRQIAEVMGIPEGTVRGRIARARALLKEKLAVRMEGRYAK